MTDRPDFETTLERRLHAYAAAGARPADATVIARSTIAAAATTAPRRSIFAGPRRPTLLIGLAALLLVAVAGAALIGRSSPTIQGVFVDGPSLDEGQFVNALALPDGRVLVGVQPEQGSVAGTTTLRCPSPCRPHLMLLDPRTGVLTATAERPTSLYLEAVALLHDGRVLVIRGSADDPDASAATIYDPVADRFEDVGAPVEPRNWPFLVTLADGRVLVGGGHSTQATLVSAELFDPRTGTFSPAGDMIRARGAGAGAVLLPDGRVLVAGGGPDVGGSAEIFDPASGTFAPTGDMSEARAGFFSSTLLSNGRVLIIGGLVPDPADPTTVPRISATAETFDPSTGRFTRVASMAAPRAGHAGSILSDGSVLVAAGHHELRNRGEPVATADAEIFDPATGTFRTTGSLHQPRFWPAAVSTGDRVLVLGGFGPARDDSGAGSTSEWFE